jgi:hypothetical protein
MQRPTNITNYGGNTARKESVMRSQSEIDVREFAREFPTPNVRQLLALCECGRVSWDDAAEVARDALKAGLKAVEA